MAKIESKKEEKEVKKPSEAEMKALEERYNKLFGEIVNVLKKEGNAVIVYQVMVDILAQIEGQIRKQMGNNVPSQSCTGSCNKCEQHK